MGITIEDYKNLEKLLGKVMVELGHKFCIIPDYIHDGYHIAIYNSEGNIIGQATGVTLKDAVEKVSVNTIK